MPIHGLKIIENFVSPKEEISLLETIDKEPWLNDLKRRIQHYGYRYNYSQRALSFEDKLGPMPNWLKLFIDKLTENNIINYS